VRDAIEHGWRSGPSTSISRLGLHPGKRMNGYACGWAFARSRGWRGGSEASRCAARHGYATICHSAGAPASRCAAWRHSRAQMPVAPSASTGARRSGRCRGWARCRCAVPCGGGGRAGQRRCHLPVMALGEHVAEDYSTLHLSLKSHPLALLPAFAALARSAGRTPRRNQNGDKVGVAGWCWCASGRARRAASSSPRWR